MSCETQQLQLNAIGADIIVTVTEDGVPVDDLDTVTSKSLVFRKPNGVSVTKTASFVTDGSDGKIKYVTQSGFLDVAGLWTVQPDLTFPSGYSGRADKVEFRVLKNI